ncbi:MAG: thiol peroxidase [Chitinivibrionales bacterium]|nr:thiol peroxidase [Chitinivibrionales bacterium]
MAIIHLQDTVIHTGADIPVPGTPGKDFTVVSVDLSEVTLRNFAGKRKILNIVPSLDTGVCAASARKFNEMAGKLLNTVVLVISADLPFAQKRFCEVEGLKNVIALSSFRSSFSQDYGVNIVDGPLKGLNARCVIILDEQNIVRYTDLVPEITQEPNYQKALEAASR